jgi:hypothetical protein
MAKGDDTGIPRDDVVIGTAKEMVDRLTVTIDPVSGEVEVAEIDPSTIRRQISYTKQNGKDKVIYAAPAKDFSMLDNHFRHLKNSFDYLIAVDTNTRNPSSGTGGKKISACVTYAVTQPLEAIRDEIRYEAMVSYLIIDDDVGAKHEPLGWHLALSHIPKHLLGTKRIGVIVDSELGQHIEMNARKAPYFSSHLLPPLVTLIYSSSDKPALFTNEMLRFCDRAATMLLNASKTRPLEELSAHDHVQVGRARCYQVETKGASKPPKTT